VATSKDKELVSNVGEESPEIVDEEPSDEYYSKWEQQAAAARKVVSDALRVPFNPNQIKQRKGFNNTNLDYVSGTDYIYRLLAVTGNEFDFRITIPPTFEKMQELVLNRQTGKKELKDVYLCTVVGEVTIPNLGTRTGIGVQKLTAISEDLVKGAATDAFKNALKYFGVGLDMYGADMEEQNAVNF
jgi:recombination DNA repair RAD52 pathway protein